MADDVNPYQSPAAESAPVQSEGGSAGNLTDTMQRYLREASPWARFLGIMGFINCGFLVLGGVIFLSLIPALSAGMSEIPGIPGVLAGGMGGLVGFIYIIGAVFMFFPARFTYKLGAEIRSYQRSGADGALETAFKNGKSLLKFTGILTIICYALLPVLLIIGVIVGIASAVL
ncbi:MAG: hypothetical protein LBL44_10570 [Treponema sp.]|jgi:hypothetical protein|nr:hypothetical protein [Treponema sp.]